MEITWKNKYVCIPVILPFIESCLNAWKSELGSEPWLYQGFCVCPHIWRVPFPHTSKLHIHSSYQQLLNSADSNKNAFVFPKQSYQQDTDRLTAASRSINTLPCGIGNAICNYHFPLAMQTFAVLGGKACRSYDPVR